MIRKIGTVVIAASMIGLAACGDDDESESAKQTVTFTSTLSGKQVKVTGAPTQPVTGGLVDVRLKNDAKAPLDLQLVRVDGNQTAEQIKKQVFDSPEGAPTPAWIHGTGGVGLVKPGQTVSSTQILEPGTYYAVSTGDEVEEAFAKFQVEGGESGGELPKTDATITASEYTFQPSGLKSGENEITFDNTGKEIHHVLALPLAKGKTTADVRRFFETNKGQPPVDFENASSTPVLDGGLKQVTAINLQSGNYVFVCFVSDRKGGPPHAAKGMITEVDVPA